MNRARAHRVSEGLPLPRRYSHQSLLIKEMYNRDCAEKVASHQFLMKIVMLCTQYPNTDSKTIFEYIARAEDKLVNVVWGRSRTSAGIIKKLEESLGVIEAERVDTERVKRVQSLTV